MVPLWRVFGSPQCRDNSGKPSLEVGQDLADVVAAGAERSKEGVADGAFQGKRFLRGTFPVFA
jgi:hypothetical protein